MASHKLGPFCHSCPPRPRHGVFPCKGPQLEQAMSLAGNKAFFVRPWHTYTAPKRLSEAKLEF